MSVQRSIRISGALAALALATVAVPGTAHHSAAPFDLTKNVTLRGTVEKWVWSNPHSWLYVTVTNANGTKQVWGFEAGSAGMLARSGWNSNDMKAGDKVIVTAHPARSGKPIALIQSVKLSTGRVLGGGFGAPPPGGRFGPPPPRK